MCSNVVLRNVPILLTVVTGFPSIVVPIVVVSMDFILFWLVWCPQRILSTLKSSMTILLAIVAIPLKSWCPYSFGPAILCLVSLLIAFVIVTLVLGFLMLFGLLTPTYIRGMSLFTIEMTSGFSVLAFVTSFLCTL